MNVLLWLKRDLRLSDHPALTLAAGLGPVLPVYIVEPKLWSGPDASARQWNFVAESLSDLRDALGRLGAPLVFRVGDAVEVLARLCKQHRISHIVSHEETGNLWTFDRDRAVAAWARQDGIRWTELPQSGVARRLANRDGWAARRDAFVAGAVLPPLPFVAVPGVEPGQIPTARALKLPADPCPHRQSGGRTQGLDLLDSFLSRRAEPYRTAMSSPLTGERACSRLSPHFAWGTVSVREVVAATKARQAERPGGQWGGALASFQSRLAWRDHFIQKLEDQPSIETTDLHPNAIVPPRTRDAARLQAWSSGETGLPFVDACQRYLRATGWLNFRMRAMLVSVASYHLWLDWRASGAHLARMFTDYEPGIHWPQVQMQSGTTGINTPRIYNPVKQGHDQDPGGTFIRTWLPELAAVPDGFVHEPWKWPDAQKFLDRRYPAPIIDVAEAARDAREAVWGARKRAGFAVMAGTIAQRHASRAAPRIAKPGPRRKVSADAQLSLDL